MDILDILLDILLKPLQPFIGLFFNASGLDNMFVGLSVCDMSDIMGNEQYIPRRAGRR